MRQILELPRLSLNERDHRWVKIRQAMKEMNLDCLLICGFPCKYDFTMANSRFISQIGGNSEFNFVIFPLNDAPTCIIVTSTVLKYWASAQDWVKDIRVRKETWADTIVSRLKELKLDSKNIGVDGLAGQLDPDGWFPYSVYARILQLMPKANFVNIGDMLERMRSIKSSEEIRFLEKAAELGDLMLDACKTTAKPGVRESEVYGKMREVMLANGGEEPTLFLWASDPHPYPHPFRLPTMRSLGKGDLIICEIHPKFGGYCTHVERTFCLGDPEKEYSDIYEGCLETYHRGLERFVPGGKISEAMAAVKQTIDSRGLSICEAGIHGHGLSSLEYPRYRHHAREADAKGLLSIEDELKPGMVFAFNIDLVDPRWRNGETGCVFAETIIVTDDKARRMHHFPIDFQIIQ